jgi:PAP2 superfamily.
MDKLSFKTKTLLSWIGFAIVFAALIVIASFYDLEISKILTKNSLPDNAYISTNGFGLFFEAIGSMPIFVMLALGAAVWFWWGMHHNQRWVSVIAAVVIVVAFYIAVNDALGYIMEAMSASIHGGIAEDDPFRNSVYVDCIAFFFGSVFSVLLLFAWKNVKKETNDGLLKWIFVILLVMACYLIIHFVKKPMGRMRFRTMNAAGDTNFSGFTPWWQKNGARVVYENLPDDQCKSFPSGHTFSAGVIYTLLCLPYLIKSWDKKWVKALLWVVTVGYTGTVAISRIVVGAHYMSDVLFGGTIAFMGTMLARELIVCKGSHIKCFKKSAATKQVE